MADHSSFKDLPTEEEGEGEATNNVNEVQLLTGHSDIVRVLLRLDDYRLVSGSDDGSVIVWDFVVGRKLHTLCGHTRPITCFHALGPGIVASGSSDKTIRVWDVDDGTLHLTLARHESSVKCLVTIDGNVLVSGANDRVLCLWNFLRGELTGTIERQEEENLHCMIAISGQRLVTGSNSCILYVYNLVEMCFDRLLVTHRESVVNLVRMSDDVFLSSSMDGAVVVWDVMSLTPLRTINFHEKYTNDHKLFIYQTRYLLPLNETHVAVAVNNGFQVFNIPTGECAFECLDAHSAPITSMVALYGSSRIVTSCVDSSIRIWSPGNSRKTRTRRRTLLGIFRGRGSQLRLRPVCVASLYAHTDCIQTLEALSEYSFASCGSDSLVALWKDGVVESERRSTWAATSLFGHGYLWAADDESSGIEWDDEDSVTLVEAVQEHYFSGGSEPEPSDSQSTREGECYTPDADMPQGSESPMSPPSLGRFRLPPPPPLVVAPRPSSTPATQLQATPSPRIVRRMTAGSLVASPRSTGKVATVPEDPIRTRNPSPLERRLLQRRRGMYQASKLPAPHDTMRRSDIIPEYIYDHAEMLRREKGLNPEQILDYMRSLGHGEEIVCLIGKKQAGRDGKGGQGSTSSTLNAVP